MNVRYEEWARYEKDLKGYIGKDIDDGEDAND